MYGGQGKTTNNFNIMPVNVQKNEETSDTDFRVHPDTNFRVDNVTQKNEETSDTDFRVHPDTNFRVYNVTNINEGLDQPRLDEMNAEVTGENTKQTTQTTTQGSTSPTESMDIAHGTGRL